MQTPARLIPPEAPAPLLPRRRQLLVSTGFVTAAAIVAWATLMGIYQSQKSAAGAEWFAGVEVPLTQPTMGFFTLVMSSVTIQWAVYAIARDDRSNTYLALGVTGLLGVAWVNQMAFLYSQLGLAVGENPEAPIVYALTGGHVGLVVAGLVFGLFMAFRTLGGSFGSRNPDGIAAVALFWHALVLMNGVMWYAVWIRK